MKKFTLIPIGDSFGYQGEEYSKTGPLTAIRLSDRQSRMIPRSALVMPLQDDQGCESTIPPLPPLEADKVLAAFELYHAGCLEWLRLAEQELSAENAVQIRRSMQQARERLLTDLGLNPAF